MPRPTLTLLLVALAVGVAGPVALGAGAAPASRLIFFRTPSNLIGCLYGNQPAGLRCDTRYPTRFSRGVHHCGQGDIGQSFRMTRNGRVQVPCTSDAAFDPMAPILRYGRTRRLGPFTCTSRRTGLTCTNARHHGWLLSRQRQRTF